MPRFHPPLISILAIVSLLGARVTPADRLAGMRGIKPVTLMDEKGDRFIFYPLSQQNR